MQLALVFLLGDTFSALFYYACSRITADDNIVETFSYSVLSFLPYTVVYNAKEGDRVHYIIHNNSIES